MTGLFQNITFSFLIALIVGGFAFGVLFTWTHFWALKNYVFKKEHFKRALFLLSFVRLVIFGCVLWFIINIHKNVLEVLIFFIAFTMARWFTFLKTKRMLQHGKNL